MRQSFACTTRVPASTSNLGPGFDTLGLALRLYNRVRVVLKRPRSALTGIFHQTAQAFFEAAQHEPVPISVQVTGEVPISRGLGSSATVRAGILLGLNRLLDEPLSQDRLLAVAARLEGHPDNVTPAIHGGFIAASMTESGVRFAKFEVPPSLKFVTVIPEFQLETEKARKLLPATVRFRDAAVNLNRTGLIVSAFAKADFNLLRGAFDDRLHQPYRKQLIPQLDNVIAAGESAGALGGWLSGSGSAVICATLAKPNMVARAMQEAFKADGIKSRALVLTADNKGAVIEKPVRR